MSETNVFAHGKYSSKTVCACGNFVRGGCVVVVRGCVVVVVDVSVDKIDGMWAWVTMDEYV